ncbi:MAG: hypothetical protein WD733_01515 [Bryobacterales bacterium]
MPPAALPRPWRVGLLILAGALLWGSYATEIADTDFWWHLKTGQYIFETRSLPAPDPFSYTTDLGAPSYEGEQQVRQFNLTHEWLAQLLLFVVYEAGGFPLLALWKGLLLSAFCAIAGYLAAWRSGNFFVGLAAAFAGMPVVKLFAADRPPLLTFLLVAVFVLILEKYFAGEWDRWVWLLIPLQWAWANLHGGFFLGWVVLGAYVAGSWNLPAERRKRLWIAAGASLAASAVNPNALNVFEVLTNYRASYLTATLIEWKRPPLWGPPYTFNVLLYLAAAVLLLNVKKVRIPDALLFLAFSAAALMAFRNVIFMAFLAPVLLASYGWPMISPRLAAAPQRMIATANHASTVAGVTLAAALAFGFFGGSLFQLRAAEWRFPQQAAGFLRGNGLEARLFNSYEYGGYLIWSLWPQQQTFIDGRALNESVYRDYQKILYASASSQDESRRERDRLLDQYGVELVVMNGFEYVTGVIYPLVLAMANPQNTAWQLVFADEGAVIFARDSEGNRDLIAGRRLEKVRVLEHLEASCRIYIEHDPELPNCARTLGFLFLQGGDRQRARAALALYLENIPYQDPEAEAAFRKAADR